MATMAEDYEEVFKKGTIVEVSSEDSGLRGSWYTATVIRTISRKTNKMLVEYHNLMADDAGTKPLREFADAILVRPIPPRDPPSRRFRLMEDVDAFHNDGWWEGVVTKVLEGSTPRYAVFFRCSREQIEFSPSDLRLHREWVHGNQWVPPLDSSPLSPRQKKHNRNDGEERVNDNHSGDRGGVTRNGEERDALRRSRSVSSTQGGVANNGNNIEVKRTSNRLSNKRKVAEQRKGNNCTVSELGVRRNGKLKEPRRRASNHAGGRESKNNG